MKRNTMAHQRLLCSLLSTIVKVGIANMRELRQVCSLYALFLSTLRFWMRDTLAEPECLALLGKAGLTLSQAVNEVTHALINQESPCHDGSCRMDLALRQARRDPKDGLSMMYHTVHFICLDLAHQAHRVS